MIYMVCSECEEPITKKEYNYSIEHYGKPLCRDCQDELKGLKHKFEQKKERSTPEARKLYEVLIKLGIPAKLEHYDRHKHIDIAIPEAKINLEIDGMQHSYNHKQALSDLKRTYYSFKKGYVTLRIPNKLIHENLYETARYIKKLIESSIDQLEEEDGMF